MQIKEIMERTGLSRKAVYYYEEQGLISPHKNQENQYRDYSNQDLQRLILISLLRDLDYSIETIQELLNSEGSMEKYVKEQIVFFKQKIKILQGKTKVLEQLASRLSNDRSLNVNGLFKGVTDFLDSGEESESYYRKKLIMDFPGPYGQTLSLFFGPLLKGPFNQEKKYAWYELLLILDTLEPDDFPPIFNDLYQKINTCDMQDLKEQSELFWEQNFALYKNIDIIDKMFKEKLGFLKTGIIQNKKVKNQRKQMELAPGLLNFKNSAFSKVMKCFEVLSPDYKALKEAFQKILEKYSSKEIL